MGYLQSKRRANFFNEWLERNMPSDPESSGKDLHNLSLISFGSFMASFPVMYLVCSHFFKSFGITRTILIQVSHIHSLQVWKFSEQVTFFFVWKLIPSYVSYFQAGLITLILSGLFWSQSNWIGLCAKKIMSKSNPSQKIFESYGWFLLCPTSARLKRELLHRIKMMMMKN